MRPRADGAHGRAPVANLCLPRQDKGNAVNRPIASFALGVAFAATLSGCGPAGGFSVENPEFHAPLGASDVGVAYFTIRSPKADKIVMVSSTAARAVEMHDMTMSGATMAMKRVESVDLPAGKKVEFKPGGLHLMVFSPIPVGSDGTFPVTIELASGLKQTIQFPESSRSGKQGD